MFNRAYPFVWFERAQTHPAKNKEGMNMNTHTENTQEENPFAGIADLFGYIPEEYFIIKRFIEDQDDRIKHEVIHPVLDALERLVEMVREA